MLEKGGAVPHIQVHTLDGQIFSYATIWQRRNLVLVVVAGSDGDDRYAAALLERRADFSDRHALCIVTRDDVEGLPGPAVLIADKWSEIAHHETADSVEGLPPVDELISWVDFVERRCPECEGESR